MQLSQRSPFRPETCRHKYVPFSSVGIQAPTRHTGNIRHSITVEKLVLHLPRYTIGLKKTRATSFIQSEVKPKPTATRWHTFSRALRRLCVITSSFDWFTGLSVFCDWLEWLLWFWFYNTQLKTALSSSLCWIFRVYRAVCKFAYLLNLFEFFFNSVCLGL